MPNVPYISSSDHESTLLISESFSATLETSLFLFQIKKNKVSDLSEGTKLKLKQKFLRTQETLKKLQQLLHQVKQKNLLMMFLQKILIRMNFQYLVTFNMH